MVAPMTRSQQRPSTGTKRSTQQKPVALLPRPQTAKPRQPSQSYKSYSKFIAQSQMQPSTRQNRHT